jgi:hypothetical protein
LQSKDKKLTKAQWAKGVEKTRDGKPQPLRLPDCSKNDPQQLCTWCLTVRKKLKRW